MKFWTKKSHKVKGFKKKSKKNRWTKKQFFI